MSRKQDRPLTKRERAELDEAIRRGYVVITARQVALRNAYFRRCELEGIAFVAVTTGRKFAHVKADTITTGLYDGPQVKFGAAARTTALDLFRREAIRPCFVCTGEEILSCGRVPLGRAGAVAAALRRLSTSPARN